MNKMNFKNNNNNTILSNKIRHQSKFKKMLNNNKSNKNKLKIIKFFNKLIKMKNLL